VKKKNSTCEIHIFHHLFVFLPLKQEDYLRPEGTFCSFSKVLSQAIQQKAKLKLRFLYYHSDGIK